MKHYVWKFKSDDGKWTTLHWTMTEEAALEWAAKEGRQIERIVERRAEVVERRTGGRGLPAPRRSVHNLAEMDQQKRDRRHINRDRRASDAAHAYAQIASERRERERRLPLEYPGF